MSNFSFVTHPRQLSDLFCKRYLRIDAMQLQQVDPLHAEVAQTQFNLLPGSSASGEVVGTDPI